MERDRNKQNGCSEGERLESNVETDAQQNADTEEEETDKLLKRDHNDVVEDAVKQRKGSNKKEGKFLAGFLV